MLAAMKRSLLVLLFMATGCASYKPAPLSVRVASIPKGANAELTCPNQPVRSATTPATFRVPPYAMPCMLVVTKAGFETEQRDVRLDSVRTTSGPAAPPRPIHFEENATPFSLLGALIVRSLDNLGARVAERATTALRPDVNITVELRRRDGA